MDQALNEKLTALGFTEEQIGRLEAEGVRTAEDLQLLSADEIKAYSGCGAIVAKKAAAEFTGGGPAAAAAATGSTEPQQPSVDLLPTFPEDDTSFLEMLRVGGVLKVEKVDVISAMRAAIANQIGLFDLPQIISARMEEFAEAQDEPVGESFYALQKLIASRTYGDILAAMGVPGNFMSQGRKNAMLARLDERLWPALRGFHQQLTAWSDSWATGTMQPMVALSVFALSQAGARPALPPGMMQPPDTTGLRDEAEGVINQINSVFAGTGIPVTRALAYDATRIKGILDEAALPAALGFANKDQMLKGLGLHVGSDFIRLERNVTRFALAIMELPKVRAGNEEWGYLAAMLTVGAAIPWDKLNQPAPVNRRTGARGNGGAASDEDASFREFTARGR